MKRFGDNPDGIRLILNYLLTPTGGIVCVIVSALLCVLIVMHILAKLGAL